MEHFPEGQEREEPRSVLCAGPDFSVNETADSGGVYDFSVWEARGTVPNAVSSLANGGVKENRHSSSRPLRVCHLGKFYPPAPGGIETHVQTLARGQSGLGAEVRVICVNHADWKGRDLTEIRSGRTETVAEMDGGIQVTRLGRRGSLCRLDFCPGLTALLHRLQEEHVDLLHLHTPNATMLLAMARARPAIPMVITHHSDIVRQRILKYAIKPIEYLVYSQAARILATSPAYAAQSPVLQNYAQKTEALPLGLDLSSYLEPSDRALINSQQLLEGYGWPLWLAVGRLVYYKGLHVALEALTRVPGTLLVIGSGPLEAQLRRQAEKLGVAERVVWHGHARPDELVGAYRAATALWFPSTARSEGFGLVQIEAMASGRPVINTAIPASGVSWVSRHGETGLTVPVNNPLALAEAANRLLAEPGLGKQLGAAGRARACQEFQAKVMAKRSLEIYARVLACKSSPTGAVAIRV